MINIYRKIKKKEIAETLITFIKVFSQPDLLLRKKQCQTIN